MRPEWELVQQWLIRANRDLRSAEVLTTSKTPLHEEACFHCQQAAEKSLKAFLVLREVDFQWTHQIELLIDLCAEVDAAFSSLHPTADRLTAYAVRFRYPGHGSVVTGGQVRVALEAAREVYGFVSDRMPHEIRQSVVTPD